MYSIGKSTSILFKISSHGKCQLSKVTPIWNIVHQTLHLLNRVCQVLKIRLWNDKSDWKRLTLSSKPMTLNPANTCSIQKNSDKFEGTIAFPSQHYLEYRGGTFSLR